MFDGIMGLAASLAAGLAAGAANTNQNKNTTSGSSASSPPPTISGSGSPAGGAHASNYTYGPSGELMSSGSSSSAGSSGGSSLTDYYANKGYQVNYKPSDSGGTVTINGMSYANGAIPGTKFVDGKNIVVNPGLVDKVFKTGTDPISGLQASLANPYNPTADMQAYLAQMPGMPEKEPTLSYAEAQKRAQDQLNPLYAESEKELRQTTQNDLIRRGFFGQMPGAATELGRVADLKGKRDSAIAGLANDMVNQSEATAQARQSLALQQWQQQVSNILSAYNMANQQNQSRNSNLYNLAGLLAARDNAEQDKAYQDAQLTGLYNGSPTLQAQSLAAQMTGMWNGQPTWDRQLQEEQLALSKAAAARAGSRSSGGSSAASTAAQKAADAAKKAYASDITGLRQALAAGAIDRNGALNQINQDVRLGLYSPEQAAQMRDALDVIAPAPTYTPRSGDSDFVGPVLPEEPSFWETLGLASRVSPLF